MQQPNQIFRTFIHTDTKIIVTVLFAAFILGAWFLVPSLTPVAQAQSSTLYTLLTAQNLDPTYPMNARVRHYNYSGSPVLTTTHTIQPYRGITINQPSQTGLPTNFAGAGILDADTPFGMVVQQYAGVASTLGKNFRADGFTGWASTAAAQENVLPQLLKNIYDSGTASTYNSRIVIQNPSLSASANVTIKYNPSSGGEYIHSGIVISPGGSSAIDLQNDIVLAGLSTFYGCGRVISDQRVVVLAQHSTANILMTFSGISSSFAGTTLYLPQLLKSIYDSPTNFTYNTSVLLMSMDGTPATVTITYQRSDGAIFTETQTASPMGGFDLRYSSALAGQSTFYGVGKLTADKPIAAIVETFSNFDANRGMHAAAYRVFPNGANSVFLPLLRKAALDASTGVYQSSGISGRLVGDTATTVTLTYYLADGTTQQRTQAVTPSNPIISFDQRYDTGLPNGASGSGILTTNPAQPIVAVVGVAGDSSVLGDTHLYYEGIGK